MKHLLKLLCLLPLTVSAGSINLAWDASTSATVTNYVLYAFTNAPAPTVVTNWTVRIEVGTNLTCRISDLQAGQWWFQAMAMAGHRIESLPRNTVTAEVPVPPPNMRPVVLQYSGTLSNFVDAVFFKLRLP